jgi:hypothetical protein
MPRILAGEGMDVAQEQEVPSVTKKKISREKEALQNYGLAVLFVGIAPLLPILLEISISGEVTEGSVIITSAIYSITIALASNNRFYFGFFFFASVIESAFYGATANKGSQSLVVTMSHIRIVINKGDNLSDVRYTFVAILVTFAALTIERFGRHMRNREEFFEFLKGQES